MSSTEVLLREFIVEVRIGVQQAPREVVLESSQSPDDVAKTAEKAMADGSPLRLVDDKGRTVVVPGDKIAFIEIGPAADRRVGFAG